jgi:spermidine synthase
MSRSFAVKDDRISSWGMGGVVLCAFFVSGAAGLIHEVVWTRLLRLVMGNTTFSITTVLCAFMGGLALGSYVGGRIIDRRADPLRVFAFLEGTIALYCFFLPWLIAGTEPLYRFLYQNTHTTFYVFSLIRFVFSGLLLLVPATFMGATLPVLARFFVRSPERVGWSVGTLYGVNTFGAVVGACIAGFLLIPTLGVIKTIYLACLLNAVVSVSAYRLYRRTITWPQEAVPAQGVRQSGHVDGEKGKKRKKKKVEGGPAVARQVSYGHEALVVLLIGYGFSGFAALVYEIAWTRVLSLLIGSSAYAFSMMLTAFILGLAMGSTVYARFADRVRDPMRTLAVLEVAIGASALAVVPFIGKLPFFVTGMISRFIGSFWVLQVAEFALVFLIMVVPTVLMGAAFPVANRIFAQRPEGVSRSVGTVYGANTLGTILGSFIGGFVLIPWIGIQHTVFTAAAVNIVVGCLFIGVSRTLAPAVRGLTAAAVVAVVCLVFALIPPWDASSMSFGPLHQALRLSKDIARSPADLAKIAYGDTILFHKEGVGTTVTVKQWLDGNRTLLVNGKPDASTGDDLQTQEMIAHIPLLLHPDPRSALVIGLASGISLGSAGLYPLESLDCVEISPAVVEACRYFDDYNHRILDDPRVTLIIEDGRNHVTLTEKRYDVIISEPSNPWIAGIADLFTREYFQLCRERLTPQGIACSWLQEYSMNLKTFRSVVRTFYSVFPNMTIWRLGWGDCLLVGSRGTVAIDYDVFTRRMNSEAIAADLKRIGIETPQAFFGRIVMGSDGAKLFAEGAPLHTDDNALVEFAAPRSLITEAYQQALGEERGRYLEADLSFLIPTKHHASALAALQEQTTRFIQARDHLFWVNFYLYRGLQTRAMAEFRKAGALHPPDAVLTEFMPRFHDRALRLAKGGHAEVAIALYREMLAIAPNDAETHLLLADVLMQQGEKIEAAAHFSEATARYAEAVRLRPDDVNARLFLADLLVQRGKVGESLRHYRYVLKLKPDMALVLNNVAWLLAADPASVYFDPTEAIRLAEKTCKLTNYQNTQMLFTLSVAYAAAGRSSDATATARKALKLALAAGEQQLAEEIQRRMGLER